MRPTTSCERDFDDYHAKLADALRVWKQTAAQINAAKDAVKGLSQGVERTTSATRTLHEQTKSYVGTVRDALGYWTRTADQVQRVASNIQAASAGA